MVNKTQIIVKLFDALELIEDASAAHSIEPQKRLAIINAISNEAKRIVTENPSNGGPIDA